MPMFLDGGRRRAITRAQADSLGARAFAMASARRPGPAAAAAVAATAPAKPDGRAIGRASMLALHGMTEADLAPRTATPPPFGEAGDSRAFSKANMRAELRRKGLEPIG